MDDIYKFCCIITTTNILWWFALNYLDPYLQDRLYEIAHKVESYTNERLISANRSFSFPLGLFWRLFIIILSKLSLSSLLSSPEDSQWKSATHYCTWMTLPFETRHNINVGRVWILSVYLGVFKCRWNQTGQLHGQVNRQQFQATGQNSQCPP